MYLLLAFVGSPIGKPALISSPNCLAINAGECNHIDQWHQNILIIKGKNEQSVLIVPTLGTIGTGGFFGLAQFSHILGNTLFEGASCITKHLLVMDQRLYDFLGGPS